MQSAIHDYVEQNKSRFLEELLAFLRIPSISTLPERKEDVAKAAMFVRDSLTGAGLENVEVIPTGKHPLVYGEWLKAPGKPTVLCYGHYDVQPPDPLELWKSPPFEPTIENGNIYARGASDDKGQMYMHVKAAETLRAVGNGKLPVNLKFLLEGEEEIGGESISKYVAEQKSRLEADVALVSDTELFADGVPTLCIGLRGLIYMEIEATGPARDLHSGMYGGAAPNAVYGLVQLLAKAKDDAGRILIPGLYDGVTPPEPAEVQSWERLPFSEKEFLENEVGASSLTGEPDQSVFARIWARPTFEVHGIAGGFTGAGSKTVIPAKALAKVSVRVVPDQDPQHLVDSIRKWMAAEYAGRNQDRIACFGRGSRELGESEPSCDSGCRQSVRRGSGPGDRVRPERGLDPDRRRVGSSSWHTHCAHGIRASRRRPSLAQREVPREQFLCGN